MAREFSKASQFATISYQTRCVFRSSPAPRSAAGKKRASHNSLRHDLATAIPPSAARAEGIERLANKIVGNKTDPVTLECAYTIAEAEFELTQVRRVKVATINRFLAFDRIEPQQAVKSTGQASRFLDGEWRRLEPSG